MSTPNARSGRPRSYDLKTRDGFADRDAANLVGALDELHERLFDVIRDLTPDVLEFVPEGGTNSAAMLCRHMAWAEASWVSSVTGEPLPQEIERGLKGGAQDPYSELPTREGPSETADRLIGIARRVRDGFTVKLLASVTDIDSEVPAAES